MTDLLREGLKKASIAGAARHLFLCVGPNCCTPADGLATWEYIKKRLKEAGLPAMRTKADCLRVCTAGPLLVVYPEGIWYRDVTPERFETILEQHLLGGEPVMEWVIARNDLCGTYSCDGAGSAPSGSPET